VTALNVVSSLIGILEIVLRDWVVPLVAAAVAVRAALAKTATVPGESRLRRWLRAVHKALGIVVDPGQNLKLKNGVSKSQGPFEYESLLDEGKDKADEQGN
jgi:hypothetical protein